MKPIAFSILALALLTGCSADQPQGGFMPTEMKSTLVSPQPIAEYVIIRWLSDGSHGAPAEELFTGGWFVDPDPERGLLFKDWIKTAQENELATLRQSITETRVYTSEKQQAIPAGAIHEWSVVELELGDLPDGD